LRSESFGTMSSGMLECLSSSCWPDYISSLSDTPVANASFNSFFRQASSSSAIGKDTQALVAPWAQQIQSLTLTLISLHLLTHTENRRPRRSSETRAKAAKSLPQKAVGVAPVTDTPAL
jgi:hypothetical protein